MSKSSVRQFLERLQRSQLVPRPELRQVLLDLKRDCGDVMPTEPQEVATHLVRVEAITEWQSDKLLAGKSRGFFLGDYKILDHICTGGMSSVYLAEDTTQGKPCAIKVFPKRRLKEASYLARFHLEAEATASLEHPNIICAQGLERHDGIYFLVMEYVRGRDLQVVVQEEGALDYATAADYIAQAAAGLQFAHDQGLIHRDVKPANLLVNEDGVVKILDLGLALYLESEASLTIAHQENVLGTADYLAPEQALDSHKVDARADIYGLGCTLYFALTGHPPFDEGSIAQRILAHQQRMPDALRTIRDGCPKDLEQICFRMMQKQPHKRFQTCEEVAGVLQQWVAKHRARVPAYAGAGGEPPADPARKRRWRRSRTDDTLSCQDVETVVSRKSKLVPNLETVSAPVQPSPAESLVKDSTSWKHRVAWATAAAVGLASAGAVGWLLAQIT